VSISPARTIAFDVLLRVETESAYASDLLHAELEPSAHRTRLPRVKSADAALATELTLGVLRQRRLLDFLLERDLKKSISKLDLPVLVALRLGLYQLRFLERIPARAAVNESVELVRRARKSSAASLVNAVLRRYADNSAGVAADLLAPSVDIAKRLAILHSHPTWLVERWLARFGEAQTLALLEANNRAPRLAFAVHHLAHRDEIVRELRKSSLHIEPGELLNSAFLARGGTISGTDAFRRGAISIQDEASQTIALLLSVRAGDRVLDLCAAPGGKTAPLARVAGDKGLAVAADLHHHRLRAMRAQLERLRLPRVRLLQLDATCQLPFDVKFDRILVDAPCSGTGTLARHPEIRWRLAPEMLDEFHRLQVAILTRGIEALVPGGRLVYSTCSLEPEENEAVVAVVLAEAANIRQLIASEAASVLRPHLVPQIDSASLFDSSGHFRTVPGAQNTDGFFAAILERTQ
jgi:16S rRNA (cytosine967-C5)-methyltransferase